MLNGMSNLPRRATTIFVAVSLFFMGTSPAFAAERKNELGMYTVKCQVVKNAPGNPIVGLVYGNHPKNIKKAKADADLYTDKFGNDVHKRHCDTQSRYKNSGAFTVNGEPI